MSSVAQDEHRCKTCGRTPDKTKFRLNGSGVPRANCNSCEGALRMAKRQQWREQQGVADDTPRVADGYAMMPYQGAVVAWDTDGGMVCLTDLWRAAGSPENNRPADWLAQDGAVRYIEACRRRGLVAIGDGNGYSRTGGANGGGSWREKIIGLEYARYLDADLAVACNQFVLERWGQARHGGLDETDRIMLHAIAQHLGVEIPALKSKVDSIGHKVDGIGQRLDDIDAVSPKPEQWVGQIYIIHITDEHQVFLLKRLFKSWPEGKPHLVAIGRTGANGDIHELRLKDYTGKIPFLPEDYITLAYFGTPTPEDCETHALQYPLAGSERLRLKNNKFSLTFLAADHQGIQAYQRIGCGKYYTLQSLGIVLPKPIVTPPPQMSFRDLF